MKKYLNGREKRNRDPFGSDYISTEVRKEICREIIEQAEGNNREDNIPGDPWEIESRRLMQENLQAQAEGEQRKLDEEVIRAIWIKTNTDWAPQEEDETWTQLKTIDRLSDTLREHSSS